MEQETKQPINETELSQVEKLALEKIRSINWVQNPHDEKDASIALDERLFSAEVSDDVRGFIKRLMEEEKIRGANTSARGRVAVFRGDLTEVLGVDFDKQRQRGE